MFTINVEDVFRISNRKGLVLVGLTSHPAGVIKIGDVLFNRQDNTEQYKIIGIEYLNFTNKEKNLTHNPAIIIDLDECVPYQLIGKTLTSA